MRQFLILLLAAVASFTTMGQKSGSYYCGNSERKSLEEIKKQFPFNLTSTIKVVSYKGYDSIPKSRGKIDFQKMFEVKSLNDSLAAEMIDLLANYENKSGFMEGSFCWNPRNGIILVDNDGAVITYVDICFSCQRYSSPQFKLFPFFCNEKMDAIKDLMKRAGITFGLKKNEPIEPKNSSEKLAYTQLGPVYAVVEELPDFPGGAEAMYKFLTDSLRYPVEKNRFRMEGRAYVEFIIEKDGSINEASVLKGLSVAYDNEAIRLVKSMPRWKPGKNDGEYVRVKVVVPVKFRFHEEK